MEKHVQDHLANRTQNLRADVVANKNTMLLFFDLPGVSKKNITINTDNRLLTVQAHRENGWAGCRMLYGEPASRSYKAEYKLPDNLDAEKIEANFENGVLSVSIPLKKEFLTRSIAIH